MPARAKIVSASVPKLRYFYFSQCCLVLRLGTFFDFFTFPVYVVDVTGMWLRLRLEDGDEWWTGKDLEGGLWVI